MADPDLRRDRRPELSRSEREVQRVSRGHTHLLAVLRWMLTRRPKRWPKWIDSETGATPPERVSAGVRYCVIHHSTVLLQVDGRNILTDPIWSERCSPVPWAGPRRVRDPGLRFEQLPPIDAVLVTHNHYDHLDVPTLRQLQLEHRPRFLVARGDGRLLRKAGLCRVEELGWWQHSALGEGVEATFVPAQHFSGRGLADRNRSLWGGYVVSSSCGPLYICGDSGYSPLFAEIGRRCGPMRLSFIPIGAYLPRWFMGPVHVDPAEALRIHRDVGSSQSVGVHFGTFQLTDEGIDDPVLALTASLTRERLSPQAFQLPVFGEGYHLDPG